MKSEFRKGPEETTKKIDLVTELPSLKVSVVVQWFYSEGLNRSQNRDQLHQFMAN